MARSTPGSAARAKVTTMTEIRIRLAAAAALLVALGASPVAGAQETRPHLPAFWADFGIGFGNLDTSSSPYGSSASSFVMDGTLGGRIGEHWLLGASIGGAGSQYGNNNANCYCNNSGDWGQFISNLFLVTEFEPGWDRGWTFGAGAGIVGYHSQVLEYYTGDYKSGDGTGGMLRIGYDWPVAQHLHLQTRLTFEAAHIGLSSPVGGSFDLHAVSLTFHVAYH